MLSFFRTRPWAWSLLSIKYNTGHITLLLAFQISISSNMDYLSPSVLSQKKAETPEVGTHIHYFAVHSSLCTTHWRVCKDL